MELIIDGNHLFHRSYHKFKNLKSPFGTPSGGVFGFFRLVENLTRKYKKEGLYINAIAFDGGSHKYRRDMLPNYRVRDKVRYDLDKEDFYRQLDVVKGIVKTFGITILHAAKHEADDLIFARAKQVHKDHKVLIWSGDKDFIQAVNKRIWVYNSKHQAIIKPHNAQRYYPYKVKNGLDWLCLDGDSSDKIPGVKGMGEKTLIKFFNEYSSVAQYLRSNTQFGKFKKELVKEVYDRNKKLISLKHFYHKILKPQPIGNYTHEHTADYNLVQVKKTFQVLGFKSFDENFILNLNNAIVPF